MLRNDCFLLSRMIALKPSQKNVWQIESHRHRCHIVGAARHEFAAACDELVSLCASDQRTDPVETVSSELIPLCAALKFIERSGAKILRRKRFGSLGRPAWLWGVHSQVERVPRGDILILAAWNYPLLLPGVQVAQALAAGNRVFLKPAPGCERVTQRLAEMFYRAGVPEAALQVLDSQTRAAIDRIERGVDLVVLTGSSQTGRAVMRQCAEKLTPTILELSGCDAVVIGRDADLSQAARAIHFGLMFNGGATCIGPRRIIVQEKLKSELIAKLRGEFEGVGRVTLHSAATASIHEAVADAQRRGASNIFGDSAANKATPPNSQEFYPAIYDGVASDWPIANGDLFAPISSIIPYQSDENAADMVNGCPYRLAASVFGSSRWAKEFASRLQVGTVTINDIIFPTADPRLPFGGRGESGFGVTRGADGLLEMTMPKVTAVHHGSFRLHLMNRKPGDFDTLAGSLTLTHGRFVDKATALLRMWRGIKYDPQAGSPATDFDNVTEQEK
jgi:acyl-CoA reductase-like NAD-dependent aldehyde dehydrogenase